MEVFYTNTIARPLSTTYLGDADLKLRSTEISTEEGLNVYRENYLLSAVDHTINNYSSLVLTHKLRNNEVFQLDELQLAPFRRHITTIKQNGNFLAITPDGTGVTFTTASKQEVVFELEILNESLLKIAHQGAFARYYLGYNGSFFYFSDNTISADVNFYYIIDDTKLALYSKRSGNMQLIWVNATVNALTATAPTDWINKSFDIIPQTQILRFDADTTWVAYDVVDKNSCKVNELRSTKHLENNNLFYTNYTQATGNEILANFITLKNQYTHKNFSYRADYLNKTNFDVPNVDLRGYTSLHTGVNQELGSDSITLAYEFYNADYRFAADKYTIFQTPSSLYPFEQININDTLFARNGAIAGDTPYTSDRIFYQESRLDKSNGQYLCTWLSGCNPDVPSVWVDRYYIPEKTSFAAALTARARATYVDPVTEYINSPLPPSAYYDAPFVYTTLESESAHTPQTTRDALYGESYFDKASDLVLVPNATYIYYRIGKEYVASVVETLLPNIIQNGLPVQTTRDVSISYDNSIDDIEYALDGSTYAMIESFNRINSTNEFTISFWVGADDWKQKLGHEIIGNYNDRGFGVLNDELITPIIMVQDGRRVLYLNTDFQVIDTIYLSQSSLDTQTQSISTVDRPYNNTVTVITDITGCVISDICRTEHLAVCSPIAQLYTQTISNTLENPYVTPISQQCGLILTEDDMYLTPDNVKTTMLESVTGLRIEPCKKLEDITILPIE